MRIWAQEQATNMNWKKLNIEKELQFIVELFELDSNWSSLTQIWPNGNASSSPEVKYQNGDNDERHCILKSTDIDAF